MNHLLFFLVLLAVSARGADMKPADALASYVQKINTHSWSEIAPLVAEGAVFIFTENTFVGKAAAQAAFEKTFDLIKEEHYSVHDVVWTAVTDRMASCYYEYRWKGLINGQEAAGGGRGTTILIKAEDGPLAHQARALRTLRTPDIVGSAFSGG